MEFNKYPPSKKRRWGDAEKRICIYTPANHISFMKVLYKKSALEIWQARK